jgi:hypothetical protein
MRPIHQWFAIAMLLVAVGAAWSAEPPSHMLRYPVPPAAVPAAASYSTPSSTQVLDLLQAQTTAIKALAAEVAALESRVKALEARKDASHAK